MKLAAIVLLLVMIIIFPVESYGQPHVFTIRMKGATLLSVFDEIERHSDYKFIYNKSVVNERLKVDVNVKNATIERVLNSVLEKLYLDFHITEHEIVVSKKAEVRYQEGRRVRGFITDENGKPMAGASIVVDGTSKGVISDNDGQYNIEADPGNRLVFSYVGYITQAIRLNNERIINVVLLERNLELEDVMVVAFAKQNKEDVIASISLVKPDLLKTPTSNLTTALAGRASGIISYQRSGEPGQDNAQFFIRGVTTFGYKKDPLILIDNNEVTPLELARIQPDDIASFSILKDAAATALYGSRGANGVILITTREGSEGKMQFRARMEESVSSPVKMIELADPVTYMRLHNEAVLTRNPLAKVPYTENKIMNTEIGRNSYVYPANNWYNNLFKDHAVNRRGNLSLSGGSKIARYYFSGSFSTDNGMLKVDKVNDFNNNINLKKFLLRSNINISVTRSTEAVFRIQGTYDDYTGPINGGTDLFNKVMKTNPVLFPPYFKPDYSNTYTKHVLFGNWDKGQYSNPYAEMIRGYKNYVTYQISSQYEVKQKLDYLTEGLSFRALFNANRYSYYDVSRFYQPFFYKVDQYDKAENQYTLELINKDGGTEYLDYREGAKDVSYTTYFESTLNWNRTFSDRHALSGLMVYTMREQLYANAGDLQKSLPYRNLGLAGRATYAFDKRYYGEINFGYNGSERFSRKERYGFFPSAGLGWAISNEPFWPEKLKKVINRLKLKTTYGLVGNDAIGDENDRFFYLSNVNLNDGANGAGFGTLGNDWKNGISISRYPDQDITWETARKFNLGIELEFWNDLEIEADLFHELRYNILMDRATMPKTMGFQSAIRANVGKASNQGIDIAANYNHSFAEGFWISALTNFIYASSKFIKFEESNYQHTPWRSHKGYSLTQNWGYVAERLFIDEYEVQHSPEQIGDYGAGDIKYSDINGDGKITEKDQVPLGMPTSPEIVYGFGFSGGWKGFDLNCFFQGLARESFWIDAGSTSPFIDGQNALLKVYADNHWSEDNSNIFALWPRLSTTYIENNRQTSSWFMRDGSFLRLKSLELGYSLPSRLISGARLNTLRFYFSGFNLLTFSKFKLWDPEMGGNGLGYPIQQVYNIGIQLTF